MQESAPEEASQDLWSAQAVTRHANLCREAHDDDINLLCYAFNQDASCFVCGTSAGFRVFKASPVTELIRQENSPAFNNRSVSFVSMLYQTSLFAMVTTTSAVHIWDESKRKFVGEVHSRCEVKSVVMRRDIIAIVGESTVNVYSLDRLKHILTLTTHDNPKGLCASAAARKDWILCCPGPSRGAVRVQVGANEAQHFQAHETELAVLAMNGLGSRVATASEFGTVVKVFQLPDAQVLYRLRVGPPAQREVISSIVFRPDDTFIAVAVSSALMVHIFKTDGSNQEAASGRPRDDPFLSAPPAAGDAQDNKGISSLLSGAMKGAMPAIFGDTRSFARFRLPDADPTVDSGSSRANMSGPLVAFHRSEPRMTILHHSGMVYEAKFDPGDGSQGCSLESAKAWFQARPDFRIRVDSQEATVVAAEMGEQEAEEADEWNVI